MKRLPLGYSLRKDGRYQCRFMRYGEQYCVYGKTLEECEAKKNVKLELLDSGLDIDNQDLTLAQYHQIWLEEQKKFVKSSSIYADEKYWAYIDKAIGKKKLSELRKQDVQFMQKVIGKKHSVDTVNRSHKVLSRILNAAMNDRIINYNIARSVRTLKTTAQKAADTNHRALSIEEQTLFFEYAKNTHYYNLYSFLVNTGARVSEALALTWNDIDFQRREITIDKTIMRTDHSVWEISDSPKTSSSNRKIPISDTVATILENQKTKNNSDNILKFNDFVFKTDTGNMSNYNNVDSAIRRLITKMNANGAYIEPFSVHAFRATFATRCIEQGMQPKTLQAILGHSNLRTTMDLYVHVTQSTKMDELNKINIAV